MTDTQGESKQWAVRLPDGQKVNLWDLPWDTIVSTVEQLNAEDDDLAVGWSDLILVPLASLKLARIVYRTAAKLDGQKVKGGLTVRELYGLFELVDDPEAPARTEGETQWEVGLPNGEAVKLWDLPDKAVQRLATMAGVFWMNVVDKPLAGTGRTSEAIYAEVCKLSDVEPLSTAGMSCRAFRGLWAEVPADLPTVYDEGLPAPLADAPPTD